MTTPVITLRQGQTLNHPFQVNENDSAKDITALMAGGGYLEMTWRESERGADPVSMYKSTKTAAEWVHVSMAAGTSTILFVPDDTKDMDPREYVADFWAVTAAGERYPLLGPVTTCVEPAISRVPVP